MTCRGGRPGERDTAPLVLSPLDVPARGRPDARASARPPARVPERPPGQPPRVGLARKVHLAGHLGPASPSPSPGVSWTLGPDLGPTQGARPSPSLAAAP